MEKNTFLRNGVTVLLVVIAIGLYGQPQYLTWDGGSGPSNSLWSQKLQLSWANPGTGDWMDANQIKQGSKAYDSTIVSTTGPVSFKVDKLVARWLANGLNRGFFLNSKQLWTFSFDGRNSTTAFNRPKLTITTNKGTFNPPCISNAYWATSTGASFDSRSSFQVSQNNKFAIVQFNLAGVSGTVLSATLTLNCTGMKYSGRLCIFEANPPAFRDGGGSLSPLMGIAKNYVYDKNIALDKDVLFAADFSDMSKNVWNVGSAVSGSTQVYDPATQSTYLSGRIPKGQLSGCDLEHEMMKGKADGTPDKVENELYARYYVYLENNWGSTVDANKMPGFDARIGWWNSSGYWQSTTGNGGSPGTGLKVWNATAKRWEYQGHSLRGHGGMKTGDGNPYDNMFWIGGYMYHLDQSGPFGESVRWNGTVIKKGKWYCIEHYMKMNTISAPYDAIGNGTANPNGIYRTWVDGVLVYERTNFRWRRHPEMGIQGFWLNWYHGGTEAVLQDMNFRMNFVVVARKYIGPIQSMPADVMNQEPESTSTSLKMYPNPANDFILIEIPEELKTNSRLIICNALGQCVFNMENITDNITKIATSDFSKGIYIVKYINEKTTLTQKFLIQ